MLDALTIATGVIICLAAAAGFQRTRDPLSPVVVFSPMLMYVYVYKPLMVLHDENFVTIFPSPDKLVIVHILNLMCVSALLIGCCWYRRDNRLPDRRFKILERELSPSARRRLTYMAVILGLFSNGVFWFMVYYTGGFVRVFSVPKPFLHNPLHSGYFGELPMMCYPAMLLLALAWQGQRLTPGRILLFTLVGLPQFVWATLGARRGPAFLVGSSLFACWWLIKRRRPSLGWTLVGIAALGGFLLLLGEYRNTLFRPWMWDDPQYLAALEMEEELPDLTIADDYVFGSSLVLTANYTGRHYWGLRYLATFVIRPIPRQLWPTKYQDCGLDYLDDNVAASGFAMSEWMDAVGFIPPRGMAGGIASDAFLEFSWLAVLFCFVIGRLYGRVWKNWTERGGGWTLAYVLLVVLSVYLPAQGMEAWGYRFVLLGVPTWLIWKNVIAPGQRRRATTVRPAGRRMESLPQRN